MTNVLTVLPDFDLKPFSHLLPSLERALVSIADLLTLDALDVAKRAQVPPSEVKRLTEALLVGLHDGSHDSSNSDVEPHMELPRVDVEKTSVASLPTSKLISTVDDTLDNALGGGISTGQLTEIVGER